VPVLGSESLPTIPPEPLPSKIPLPKAGFQREEALLCVFEGSVVPPMVGTQRPATQPPARFALPLSH
jgi:hypothetical protein